MQADAADILPDFSEATSPADVQALFEHAAARLIREWSLEIDGRRFDITSLELYLKDHARPHIWFDDSTDGADEQCEFGIWYISKKKGPSRWRIDIAVGNRAHRIQGGILIRQLNGKGGVQPGPATALHQVVRGQFGKHAWTDDDKSRINRIQGKRIDGSDGSPLVLRRRPGSLPVEIATGKRFNISKRVPERVRSAPLRVSLWRSSSDDTRISAA